MANRSAALLRLYYFSFFAAAGIYVPYLGLYTRGLGFASLQIGFIAALTPLSKILFPPFWGAIADRTGSRKSLILLTTALSVAAFSLLFVAHGFAAVSLAILAYAFFHAPILALSETLVLEESARRGFVYGRIRVWGSLGYLLAALILGKVLDLTSLETFVTAFVAVSLLQLGAALGLPAAPAPRARRAARGVLEQLRRKDVVAFLIACTLMEVSHSGYNGFFSIHLSENGYSKSAIGPLVALPVFCEIAAMMVADGWMRRWGSRWMMSLAFGAAVLRWGVLALTTAWVPIALSQTLHALTYGFFHVTAVHTARRFFPAHLQASAQSLYIGLTYGVGGAVGLLAAGHLYDAWGGRVLFLICSGVALLGLPLVLRRKRPEELPSCPTGALTDAGLG
jgi:PPP family 3-phenylpropionic acid transporter